MFLLKALTAFSSGLSFQGSLLSKQLWKIEGVSPSGAGADLKIFFVFFLSTTIKIISLSGANVEHYLLTVPLKECFLSFDPLPGTQDHCVCNIYLGCPVMSHLGLGGKGNNCEHDTYKACCAKSNKVLCLRCKHLVSSASIVHEIVSGYLFFIARRVILWIFHSS